jgi:hypothetical protein
MLLHQSFVKDIRADQNLHGEKSEPKKMDKCTQFHFYNGGLSLTNYIQITCKKNAMFCYRDSEINHSVEFTKYIRLLFCQENYANAFSMVRGKGGEVRLHRTACSSLGTGTFPEETEVVTCHSTKLRKSSLQGAQKCVLT